VTIIGKKFKFLKKIKNFTKEFVIEYSLSKILPTKSSKNKTKKI
jgi:hypothetical protein